MKKNIYYRTLYGEPAAINRKLGAWVAVVLGYPKSVLDVFLRRNMGERYFTLFRAFLLLVALYWLPEIPKRVYGVEMYGQVSYYIFLAAFAGMSVLRYLEIRREPSVFDFEKFSLSRGIPHRFFLNLKIFGVTPSSRTIEVYLEPLLCLLVGLVLMLLSQGILAAVIIICSISYFMCNMISAVHGDHFIMDKIDEMLLNKGLNDTFIHDKEVSSHQVPFYTRKPSTEELRKNFVDFLNDNDDDDDAVPIK